MTSHAVYPIYTEPVPLEMVVDGLYVAVTPPASETREDDYFKSAELFTKPMIKPARKKA